MAEDSASRLSAEELSAATGEPVERLHRLRSLKLIGSEGDERFAPEDAERIRLIHFLERRQIGLETIARGGYVGGALNIASRVATQATPHQILITAAARTEIGALSQVTFTPLAARRLKGLTGARSDARREGQP